ncbi:hypothetical protein A9993_02420 [Rahnella victoriana]|uniref:YodC family protein n=1 Tax=Rahnella victoriana TaxID=1510570 RepID=UPI000BB17759|nr:DUF2158 domain-containing protein [Rahnella victoriana]PBI78642.1 hypothetical protein A9993_02420 [Rahnella victoriana]
MENVFKPGHVVRVKSGGPLMTVVILENGNGGYKCQWFNGSILESGFFPLNSLELAAHKRTDKVA